MNESFRTEKNKSTNVPIYLYTIYDYNGEGDNLNFAEWDEDIIFDEVTYHKFPIKHDEIGENTQNETPAIKVKISNVSRLIQYYLEAYDWRNKKVRIRLIWLDKLDEEDTKLDFIFYIDSYTANESIAEFLLLPKIDALGVILPKRVYSRNYCQWRFKGVECGYSGVEIECNKTKQRCKELNNYIRFGGFPAIPEKKMYV